MLKKIFLINLLLLLVNCVTVGRVGYLVPAESDSGIIPNEIIAETCEIILIDILNNLNYKVRNTKSNAYKDVTIVFDQGAFTACLQLKK